MDQELIHKLRLLVEQACKSKANRFGYGIWSHHIEPMMTIAQRLANEYLADKEIVAIACLLHDLAQIKDYSAQKDHHILGASDAEGILATFQYPRDRIDLVKACILNHRGSIIRQKATIEEICVADADAIAHMDQIASLFYFVYRQEKMEIDEGLHWIIAKLQRDWEKLSSRGKDSFRSQYDMIISMLR